MTEKIEDGGPAFPRDHAHDGHNGMTLRDHFATHANIGDVDQLQMPTGVLLLGRECPPYSEDIFGCYAWWAEYRATLRFIEADAMLKARSTT